MTERIAQSFRSDETSLPLYAGEPPVQNKPAHVPCLNFNKLNSPQEESKKKGVKSIQKNLMPMSAKPRYENDETFDGEGESDCS